MSTTEDISTPALSTRKPFPEQAEELRREGRKVEALHCCLVGLRIHPADFKGRFILARVLYELGYLELAVRELSELKPIFPQNGALLEIIARSERLLLGKSEGVRSEGAVIAEAEFDLDEITKLEDP